MSILSPDHADYVICGYDCDHPQCYDRGPDNQEPTPCSVTCNHPWCITALASMWADAAQPLVAPF